MLSSTKEPSTRSARTPPVTSVFASCPPWPSAQHVGRRGRPVPSRVAGGQAAWLRWRCKRDIAVVVERPSPSARHSADAVAPLNRPRLPPPPPPPTTPFPPPVPPPPP